MVERGSGVEACEAISALPSQPWCYDGLSMLFASRSGAGCRSPASIATSVNRRGNWERQGVRIDVNLRTKDIFVRIDEAIEGLKDDFSHLRDVSQFLENLKDDVEEWRKDFLTRVALAP